MNKRDLQKRSLDNQERHPALGMPTLEMAHVRRERDGEHLQNNIKTKLEQLKLIKTDSSIWQ
jgi:hypothetical protein